MTASLRSAGWITASTALLLAALLLPPDPPPLHLARQMAGSFDFELRRLGQPVGHYRSETRLAGDRVVFTSELETTLPEQGLRRLEERLEFSATPPFVLLDATRSDRNAQHERHTSLRRDDGGYEARIRRGGRLERRRLDWSYALSDHLALELALARREGEHGQWLSARRLDLERLAPESRNWRLIHRGADGGYLLRVAAPAEEGLIHLDERMVPRSMTIDEHFSLKRTGGEDARSGAYAQETAAAELISSRNAFVALPEPIRAPRRVERAELRVPAAAAAALGPARAPEPREQPLEEEALVLLRLDAGAARSAGDGDALAARAPGRGVPSDHPMIAALLAQALEPGLTPREQVTHLTRFVHEYFRYSDEARPLDLLDALTERRGNCTEYANLFTALARAAGLPARTLTGLVYGEQQGPGFYLHAWNEVLLDGAWHPIDPTLGITRITGLHIPFPASHGGYLRSYAAFAEGPIEIASLERRRPR